MYRIRGQDGREEGPVAVDTLRAWLAEGRIHLATPVAPEGSSEWRPLSEVRGLFASKPPPLPLPLPATPPLPSRPAPSVGHSTPPPPRGRLSRLAVLSVACGALGFLILPGIIGFLLGVVAESSITRSRGGLRGRGLAFVGIILSAVMSFLGAVAVVGVVSQQAAMRNRPQGWNAPPADCGVRLAQLGTSLRQYANDHADLLPASTNWCDEVRDYTPSLSIYTCPTAPGEERSSFAMNAEVGGRNLEQLPPETVVLYGARLGWNGSGGAATAAADPGFGGGVLVLTADGTVVRKAPEELPSLRWKP